MKSEFLHPPCLPRLDRLDPYRELPTILHPATSSTRRIRALIVGLITVVFATATLITRWILIQSIHDGIVDKFNRSQPLFFKRHPICDVIEIRDEFNIITFPAACLLFVMFSLTSKRVSFHHGKGCKGYIGVPIPFDVFTHVKRTFAAVIFSVSADDLIEIANRALRRNISSSNDGKILVIPFAGQCDESRIYLTLFCV